MTLAKDSIDKSLIDKFWGGKVALFIGAEDFLEPFTPTEALKIKTEFDY